MEFEIDDILWKINKAYVEGFRKGFDEGCKCVVNLPSYNTPTPRDVYTPVYTTAKN